MPKKLYRQRDKKEGNPLTNHLMPAAVKYVSSDQPAEQEGEEKKGSASKSLRPEHNPYKQL